VSPWPYPPFPASCPFRLSIELFHPLAPQTVREVCFPSVKLRPLIRLSCSLHNKAYTPISLELLSGRNILFCKYLPYSTAPNRSLSGFSAFALLYIFRLSSCRLMEAYSHSPLPHLCRKIQDTAEPLRSGKVMLSLPSPLLRTHLPPSCLSAHFVNRLIVPTSAPYVSIRTRRASPVDSTPLYPCRR
jgi:hypothetical protein